MRPWPPSASLSRVAHSTRSVRSIVFHFSSPSHAHRCANWIFDEGNGSCRQFVVEKFITYLHTREVRRKIKRPIFGHSFDWLGVDDLLAPKQEIMICTCCFVPPHTSQGSVTFSYFMLSTLPQIKLVFEETQTAPMALCACSESSARNQPEWALLWCCRSGVRSNVFVLGPN